MLKCYAKTFVKVDAQVKERLPTDYLQLTERIFLPKAPLQETENSKTYGEYT